MRITVRHVIVQEFAPPARSLIQKMRLRPRACESQHVTSWSIESDVDCQMRERQDAFGNFVQTLDADGPLQKLTITARGEIDTFDTAGVLRGETDAMRREASVGTYFRLVNATEGDGKRLAFEQALAALRDR